VPRGEMGTPGAPRSPRRGPSRWPAGRGECGAGAAGWAPASSGGVLAIFLLRQVGVCAGADRCVVVAGQVGFSHCVTADEPPQLTLLSGFGAKKLIFSEDFRGFSHTLASPLPCTTLALVRRRLGG
jgi:hypothetical protein